MKKPYRIYPEAALRTIIVEATTTILFIRAQPSHIVVEAGDLTHIKPSSVHVQAANWGRSNQIECSESPPPLRL